MLSKFSIQLSVDGWCCVPSLLLIWGQTMVEVMKIMLPPSKGPSTHCYTQYPQPCSRPSGPITSWQIDGETMEIVTDFIFWGSKITADGDCSHEIKRHLLRGRKAMPNLDSILKSKDITLPTKVCLVKAMVFPVVICGCEIWTIKKAEHQRLDVFEQWCWKRLLRVHLLDCKEIQPVHPKGNQS